MDARSRVVNVELYTTPIILITLILYFSKKSQTQGLLKSTESQAVKPVSFHVCGSIICSLFLLHLYIFAEEKSVILLVI